MFCVGKRNSIACLLASVQARNALKDITEHHISVRQAAKKWGAPRTTLNDSRKGRYQLGSKFGPMSELTADEEQLLADWVTELSRRGLPIT